MLGKIKEKKEISTGTLLVDIDLMGNTIEFKPGQFFFITQSGLGVGSGKSYTNSRIGRTRVF